jgi:hypothetical protein
MGRLGWETADAVDMFASLMYVIVIQGALESSYSDRLSGMTIMVFETPDGPCTTLAGVLIDQAALQGVLRTLYDLGLPVLSVASA